MPPVSSKNETVPSPDPKDKPVKQKRKSDEIDLAAKQADAKNIRQWKKALDEGNIWLGKGELDAALVYFDRTIDLKDDYVFSYYDRGVALGQKAEFYFKTLDKEKAFEFWERAIADYDRALKMDAKYTDAYNNRGVAYLNMMNPEAAIADFTRALKTFPDNLYNVAPIYQNRANAYILLRNDSAAIDDFTNLLKFRPNSAYIGRGNAHLRQLDFDDAISDCTKAKKIAETADATECLTQASARKQEIEELQKSEPKTANDYYTRGKDTLLKSKDYDSAINDLSKVIDMAPNLYVPRTYAQRGTAKNRKGEYDSAISDLKAALDANPKLAEAHFQLGLSYIGKRASDAANGSLLNDAIDHFSQALKLDPKFGEASYHRALAYIDNKKIDADTERDMLDAVENYFDKQLAYIRLASLYDLMSQNATGDLLKELRDKARSARIRATSSQKAIEPKKPAAPDPSVNIKQS